MRPRTCRSSICARAGRRAAPEEGPEKLQIVDLRTGRVVFDTAQPIRRGAKTLGRVTGWSRAVRAGGAPTGILEQDGLRAAVTSLSPAAGNQNRWAVVAVARTPLP